MEDVYESQEPVAAGPPLNRMLIAVLALLGLLLSTYLTLYKFGVIGTLACGTGSCETVQASKWAVFMGIPVPLMGLLGYAVLFVVALIGLQPDKLNSRALATTLWVLASGAFVFSAYLSYLEQFVIHAWCRWCIVSAIIATLIWLATFAELPRLRRAK